MANLRQYRRDQERIANTLLEKKDINNADDFDKEYNKYMRGQKSDPAFKKDVLKVVKGKQGKQWKKVTKEKKQKRQQKKDKVYTHIGTEVVKKTGKKRVVKIYFDEKAKRYRDEKGRWAKVTGTL